LSAKIDLKKESDYEKCETQQDEKRRRKRRRKTRLDVLLCAVYKNIQLLRLALIS
jgi:hypothetical protein